MLTVPARDGIAAGAEVKGITIDADDVALGLLQSAGVSVIIEAGIQAGQALCRGQLTQGQGLHDALAGQQNVAVFHARQPQGAGQIDDLNGLGADPCGGSQRPAFGMPKQIKNPIIHTSPKCKRRVTDQAAETHHPQSPKRKQGLPEKAPETHPPHWPEA